MPKPEMWLLPRTGFSGGCEHHLAGPAPVEDVIANGIILVVKDEVGSSIQAEKFKRNLVQGPHKTLVHPCWLLNRQARNPPLNPEVFDPNRHLMGARWRDSHTVPRDDRMILHIEAHMRSVRPVLGEHSGPRRRHGPTGFARHPTRAACRLARRGDRSFARPQAVATASGAWLPATAVGRRKHADCSTASGRGPDAAYDAPSRLPGRRP